MIGLHQQIQIIDIHLDDGNVHLVPRQWIPATPSSLASVAANPDATALLLWEEGLELPNSALIAELLEGPCHVWHAGLHMGQAGQPVAWNTICHGRSMLSCDVEATTESTSWKLSARAVLIRNEVLEQLGGFDPDFDTLSGASLDAGLRWIQHGALIRHVPDLLSDIRSISNHGLPTGVDGIRIVRRRLGPMWATWAAVRGLRQKSMTLREIPSALRIARRSTKAFQPSLTGLSIPDIADHADEARVTVLVPSVGRYPFLEKLLVQLGAQTRPPDEVIVVDQNPQDERQDLHDVAPGLPLQVIHLLPPGQCTARNMGLQSSSGSHILFLDDDDEIPTDLIERHLEVLAHEEVSVSCGLVDDAESGPAPASLRFRQVGITFPTNNAMIRREVLHQTGLFDPIYDRGSRADHDLGMRSYLSGNLHVYDPRPQVFHHHAPMGGLRTHGARIRTRNNSRSTITERHLRTPTDTYLGLRYHTDEQVREGLAMSAFATLTGQGSKAKRLGRLIMQLALLPSTMAHNRKTYREGEELLNNRPPLPYLDDRT